MATKELKRHRFEEAQKYVEKALKIDDTSSKAKRMIGSIKRAKTAYESEKKRLKLVEESKKKKEEKKRRKQEKKLKRAQKQDKKVIVYLKKAEKALGRKKFGKARGYADKNYIKR